jgi:hypothetical protein
LIYRLGWDEEDRVNIYYDNRNHKKWAIEKSNNKKDSFKFHKLKGKNEKYYKLVFRFRGSIKECDRKIRSAFFEVKDEKVIVNASLLRNLNEIS